MSRRAACTRRRGAGARCLPRERGAPHGGQSAQLPAGCAQRREACALCHARCAARPSRPAMRHARDARPPERGALWCDGAAPARDRAAERRDGAVTSRPRCARSGARAALPRAGAPRLPRATDERRGRAGEQRDTAARSRVRAALQRRRAAQPHERRAEPRERRAQHRSTDAACHATSAVSIARPVQGAARNGRGREAPALPQLMPVEPCFTTSPEPCAVDDPRDSERVSRKEVPLKQVLRKGGPHENPCAIARSPRSQTRMQRFGDWWRNRDMGAPTPVSFFSEVGCVVRYWW